MTSTLTPEQIATSLTKAQRKWLPYFGEEPSPWMPPGLSKKTRVNLTTAGLVKETRPEAGFGLIKFNLTPLGLSVRKVLQDREQGGGK